MTATTAAPAALRPDPAQHAALRAGCALLAAPPHRHRLFRMAGEDRVRFLQGLVTCDVQAIEPGAGTWGFFTGVKGRILAEVAVLASADAFWLRLPAAEVEAIREHALKYRIADRVEIEPASGKAALTVAGPGSVALLAGEGVEVGEDEWSSAEVELAGLPVLAVRAGLLGVPATALWGEAGRLAELGQGLRDRHPDLLVADEPAAEAVRVEAGIARFGRDYGGEHFPQETGLGDRGVSYSKGCYLGQEVVARIHYRGGVQRGPAGLRVPQELIDAGLDADAPLLHEGRPAGRLTSVVYSPALDGWIGLSLLHRRASEPGTVLAVEGLGEAEVAALPFIE